jgi:hypothetical protein
VFVRVFLPLLLRQFEHIKGFNGQRWQWIMCALFWDDTIVLGLEQHAQKKLTGSNLTNGDIPDSN